MLFELDAAEFFEVPVVSWDGVRVTAERGAVPVGREVEVLSYAARYVPPGEDLYGVFVTEVGVELVKVGGDVPSAHTTILDVSERLEGSMSLEDLRARLRQLTESVEAAERAGWQVSSPMTGAAVVLRRDG